MNDMANSPMNSSLLPSGLTSIRQPCNASAASVPQGRLTRWYVLVGGLAVLAAITLIFFYLAYVVLPLFRGADLETREALTPAWMQQAQVPLLLSIEEQNQVAMRVGGQGEILFFNAKTGVELKRVALPLPAGSEIRSIAQDQPGSPTVALGLSNGQVLVSSTPTRSPTRTTRRPSPRRSPSPTARPRSVSIRRAARWSM
ncbi:membrane protein component of ABC phosphate transporter [Pseudomonas aeruginosa]|nr:membrane protein component of ABC phosphate transporter [Pseudomonas aeruginosa]